MIHILRLTIPFFRPSVSSLSGSKPRSGTSEQFKPELFADAATGEPAGDSGVAFAQTNSYLPTWFKCGTKGHTVNDCPKLDAVEQKKVWADRKAAQEAKQGVAHVVVADAAAATPAPAPAKSAASVPGSNS